MRVFVFFIVAVCFYGFFPISFSLAHVFSASDIMDPDMHNICAITFDDGPKPGTTPKVLDVLKEENVRATFFVLGAQVGYYPSIAKRIHEEGHEVANHAFSHTDLTTLSAEEVRREIRRTNAAVEKVGIPQPRFLRPPFGAYDYKVTRALSAMGMDLVLWSTDSFDWRARPDFSQMPNMANEHMTEQTQRGIFLFHDTKRVTAKHAKEMIETLRELGCEHFVTVSEYFEYRDAPELMALLRENSAREKEMREKGAKPVRLELRIISTENDVIEQAYDKKVEDGEEGAKTGSAHQEREVKVPQQSDPAQPAKSTKQEANKDAKKVQGVEPVTEERP